MLHKTMLLLLLIPAFALCRPLLIKDYLDSQTPKIIVIDTTIRLTDLAKEKINNIFKDKKTEIIPLSDYLRRGNLLKETQVIFWGLLTPNGLLWKSLAGEQSAKIKENYTKIPDEMSFIMYGQDPLTKGNVLIFGAKKEESLTFYENKMDKEKSVNVFYKNEPAKTGMLDENFSASEFKSKIKKYTEKTVIKPDDVYQDRNITVYSYKILDIVIVTVPDKLDFLYIPKDVKPFGIMAKENNFRYQINSSYFAGTHTDAKHCGWLKIYGKQVDSSIMEDKQLKYITRIDKNSKMMENFYYKDFKPEQNENTLEFQTGPLVIENSLLADTAIRSSINWQRITQRTLIACTEKKNLFLISVREGADLIELGKLLLKLSVFKGKCLDVMNLDGGSSVSFYSKNIPELNYRLKTQLPLLIGIK